MKNLETLLKKASQAPWAYRTNKLLNDQHYVVIPDAASTMKKEDAELIVLLRNNADKFLALINAAKQMTEYGEYSHENNYTKINSFTWHKINKIARSLNDEIFQTKNPVLKPSSGF